jgi:uncharacterized protein DUF4154
VFRGQNSRPTRSALKRCGEAVLRHLMTVALVLSSLPTSGQGLIIDEYRAKANYLSHFLSFVEWPEDIWPSKDAPFSICVLGQYSFGINLAELTRGVTVHERRVEIKWMRNLDEVRSCQVLFVSGSEQKRYAQVLEAVHGERVLTVGETPDFLDAGGMVGFVNQKESLRFDVNVGEANKAHLKISSRMLALARRVMNPGAAAKS